MAHTKAEASLVRNKNLSPLARLLMMDIQLRTWRSGETDVGISVFADALGVGNKPIMKAMSELVAAGLVERQRRQNSDAITRVLGSPKSGSSNIGSSKSGSSKSGSAKNGSTSYKRVDKKSLKEIDKNIVDELPSTRMIAKSIVNEYLALWLRAGRRWPAGYQGANAKRVAIGHVEKILDDEKSTESELIQIVLFGIRTMLAWDAIKYKPYKVSNVFGQAGYWLEWREMMQSAGRPGSNTDDHSSRPKISEEDI